MPTNPAKPTRAQRSVTLPPSLNDKLQAEADSRLLNPSLLVERALAAYLPTLSPLSSLDSPEP